MAFFKGVTSRIKNATEAGKWLRSEMISQESEVATTIPASYCVLWLFEWMADWLFN